MRMDKSVCEWIRFVCERIRVVCESGVVCMREWSMCNSSIVDVGMCECARMGVWESGGRSVRVCGDRSLRGWRRECASVQRLLCECAAASMEKGVCEFAIAQL